MVGFHFLSFYIIITEIKVRQHFLNKRQHVFLCLLIFYLTRAGHLFPPPSRSIQSMSPFHFLNIHFNIIHPSTSVSSEWSPSLRARHQNHICTSPVRAACPTHLILLDFITCAFKKSKNWVKLQFTFFLSSTLSSVCYVPMRFVVLAAAFLRIQVFWVDAVSLCEWFPTFRKWVLRSFETSGTTHQTTQPIIPENLNPHFTASLEANVS
jgi:hypothetical protein